MPPLNDVLRARMNPLVSTIVSHRMLLYTLVSVVAVFVTVLNALKNHSNFYSVSIYLSKSSRSVIVLANFGFLLALWWGRLVQQVFFGQLRPAETERLYDRLWFFVTESLLAFTIFRDEFDVPFGLMFGFLVFVKSFHWLASDRIEWMDQRPYPGPEFLFHLRMNALLLVLGITDFVMFVVAVESIATNGMGGIVLFASEYTILMATCMNIVAKYYLSLYEIRRASTRGGEDAPPWEDKSMYVFYIELMTDFVKLLTYLGFFVLIILFYGLPLYLVREVYITGRSFLTRLRALSRYQVATRNMDERYPNATEEEMNAMSDRTCIICREEMVLPNAPRPEGEAAPQSVPGGPNTTPKKLPCGHIFHFNCLRSWLERQQSCPTCRRTVLDAAPPRQPGAPAGPAGAQQQPGVNNPPQPGNAAAPGAVPLPPEVVQPDNPLAVLGRMLGLPPPPLDVPNQLHLPARQPGITIRIDYQVEQRRADPNRAPPPPRDLLPPPRYAGFQGPGGQWQEWGMDERWFQPPPAQDVPTPDQPAGGSPAVALTTPLPLTPAAGPTNEPTSISTAPPASGDTAVPEPTTSPNLTPREAAAQAALRRFGSPTAQSTPNPQAVPTTTTSSPSPPVTHNEIPTTNPSSTAQASSTSPASSASPTSNGQPTAHPPAYSVPSLIPLGRSTQPAAATHVGVTHPPTPPTLVPPQISNGALAPNGFPIRRPDYPIRPRMPSQRQLSMSELPQILTEEQLAVMDRLTRDAIDERLRVLEGVSGAVQRCMDDLMRMRSTFPVASTAQTAYTRSTTTSAPAEPQNAPASASAESAQKTTAGTPSINGASSNGAGPSNVHPAPADGAPSSSGSNSDAVEDT